MIFQIGRKSVLGILALPSRLLSRDRRLPKARRALPVAAPEAKPKPKRMGFLQWFEHMLASACVTMIEKGEW